MSSRLKLKDVICHYFCIFVYEIVVTHPVKNHHFIEATKCNDIK